MIVLEDLEIEKKLEILSDAAKYDVACTSSGVERKGSQEGMGNATHCGICHSFAADGRCISLLKVLMTNECIYDCKYCINRRSNDTVRTSFTPQELCGLTIQFYRRNYIEGLFLSSGIRRSPDETMEQIYRVLFLLRRQYHFNGYIHVKGIPGASAEKRMQRTSVNLMGETREPDKSQDSFQNRTYIRGHDTASRKSHSEVHRDKQGGSEAGITQHRIQHGEILLFDEADRIKGGFPDKKQIKCRLFQSRILEEEKSKR